MLRNRGFMTVGLAGSVLAAAAAQELPPPGATEVWKTSPASSLQNTLSPGPSVIENAVSA